MYRRRAWTEEQMYSSLADSEFLEWLQSVDALAERSLWHRQSRGKIRTRTWLARRHESLVPRM